MRRHSDPADARARMPRTKKESGIASITYAEALEVAPCFGWIDGQKSKLDEYWLQRFTLRRAKSKWSKVNRSRAEELIAAGRMRPAGQARIDEAKADGRWEQAYASQKTATVPDDLQAALDADPAAAEFFALLDSRNRYAILYRVGDAKKPETRRRRSVSASPCCESRRKSIPEPVLSQERASPQLAGGRLERATVRHLAGWYVSKPGVAAGRSRSACVVAYSDSPVFQVDSENSTVGMSSKMPAL